MICQNINYSIQCTRVHFMNGGNNIAKRIDVAKLAGVSEATVSRVFNGIHPLREETKKKVLEAAAALNYRPNALAQSFATGKSGNIGVIVPYLSKVHLLSTYYFSEILSGISSVLAENNYHLLLIYQSPEKSKDYVQLFQSQKIDGCIILGAKDAPDDLEAIQKLHGLGLPYCLVNQTFADYPFNSIDAEHYEGSFKAVSFLLEKGFQKIAFLNGPPEYSNSLERLKGYQDALNKFGIQANSNWIFQGNYSRTSGIKAAAEMAEHMPELDAVFAGNDRMAIGLMQGLDQYNFRVGRDYALLGYDDSDVSKIIQPQLSSVKVPFFDLGRISAEKIVTILVTGKTESFNERLPVTLTERASTDYPVKKERE